MKRRTLLESAGAAALLLASPVRAGAKQPDVPWQRLRRALDGRLLPVHSPLAECRGGGAACDALFTNLRNPYFIGDDPALTQTLGYADAWTSAPSVYAVAAEHAGDVAAAIEFARHYGVKLAVRGGAHSYQGTSNAADSLLLWTRRMRRVEIEGDAVKLDAGCIWHDAYEAVTTQHGRYVQGGGCTTVGVAGLVQSGGFGSFSKRFGTAAASLRSAQVVTADAKIRTVDATHDPDLFWALKGGGGGTFGVVTSLTLALHDLPGRFGAAFGTIRATSDDAYKSLIRRFVAFYREALFNPHWGESVTLRGDNVLEISMVAQGLDSAETAKIWEPFFTWIKASPGRFQVTDELGTVSVPARAWWDGALRKTRAPDSVRFDDRPGRENDWWWSGDGGQVGWFLYGFGSLWLPASLLGNDDAQQRLADALFAATRRFGFALHFNKGLAGAPDAALAATRATAMNPVVLTSFALAITADGAQGKYPGTAGREPDLAAARSSNRAIQACMDELRTVAPEGGAYVSESNYFERDYRKAFWGVNAPRLARVKKKFDPHGLFAVHHGVTG